MRRTASTLVAAAILTTGLSLASAPEAGAAAPAPTIHESTTPSSSASPKSAVVYCPAGTAILGGGAQILGGDGQVAITAAYPMFNPLAAPAQQRSFRVLAAEDKNGTASAWGLTASVYCTSQTATTVVSAQSPLSSAPVKSVPVNCPEGMYVVGAGGYVTVGSTPDPLFDAQVNLVSFRPTPALTGVVARGTEPGGILDDQYAGVWRVTAVAVCGYLYAFDGLELRSSTVSPWLDATDLDARTEVWCTKGKRLVAAAADLADDTANTYLDWAIRSNLADTKVSASVHLNAEMGISSSSDLTVYGICVDG